MFSVSHSTNASQRGGTGDGSEDSGDCLPGSGAVALATHASIDMGRALKGAAAGRWGAGVAGFPAPADAADVAGWAALMAAGSVALDAFEGSAAPAAAWSAWGAGAGAALASTGSVHTDAAGNSPLCGSSEAGGAAAARPGDAAGAEAAAERGMGMRGRFTAAAGTGVGTEETPLRGMPQGLSCGATGASVGPLRILTATAKGAGLCAPEEEEEVVAGAPRVVDAPPPPAAKPSAQGLLVSASNASHGGEAWVRPHVASVACRRSRTRRALAGSLEDVNNVASAKCREIEERACRRHSMSSVSESAHPGKMNINRWLGEQ